MEGDTSNAAGVSTVVKRMVNGVKKEKADIMEAGDLVTVPRDSSIVQRR